MSSLVQMYAGFKIVSFTVIKNVYACLVRLETCSPYFIESGSAPLSGICKMVRCRIQLILITLLWVWV